MLHLEIIIPEEIIFDEKIEILNLMKSLNLPQILKVMITSKEKFPEETITTHQN